VNNSLVHTGPIMPVTREPGLDHARNLLRGSPPDRRQTGRVGDNPARPGMNRRVLEDRIER
jgi:hypothetical protein